MRKGFIHLPLQGKSNQMIHPVIPYAIAGSIWSRSLPMPMDLIADIRNIHPTDKQNVGLRLANLALAGDYGKSDVVSEFSLFERMRINCFDDATTGNLFSPAGLPVAPFRTDKEVNKKRQEHRFVLPFRVL